MIKTIASPLKSSSVQFLEIPDWYIDPRDFHEAILKTSLETKKIVLPKIAKKHKWKASIWYICLQDTVLDIWFLSVYIQMLMSQGHDGLTIIYSDYSSSYFDWKQIGAKTLQSVYGNSHQVTIPKVNFYGKRDKSYTLSKIHQFAVQIAQCVAPIKDFCLLSVGTQKPKKMLDWDEVSEEFLVIDRMMEYLHKQKNHAIIVLWSMHEEIENEYNGSRVFESIVTTLERSVKKISVNSAIGELHLFFG